MAARFKAGLLRGSGAWSMALFLVLSLAATGYAYRTRLNRVADNTVFRPRCVSCGTKPLPEVVNGFLKINLGYPIANWFPVDVDGDGTWELAITVGETPTRVGVYEPERDIWASGPLFLPVTGTSWGVGDWDDNGELEYAYYASRSMRHFDTRSGVDTILWSKELVPSDVVVWGQSADGRPLTAWMQGQWNVYDLLTGTLEGGLGTTGLVRLFSDTAVPGREFHLLYTSFREVHDFEGPGFIVEYRQNLRLVNKLWAPIMNAPLPGFTDDAFLRGQWTFGGGCSIPASGVDPRPRVVTYVYTGWNGSLDAGQYLTCHSLGGIRLWMEASPICEYCPPQPPRLAGIAAWDVTGDGAPGIVLSLASGAGWEIRDPDDGSVIDTIEGMPKADLRNGPLYGLGRQDLFYVADSSLYIWEPDYVAPVIYDHTNDGGAAHLELRAVPNPFNGTVTLSWPDDDSPASLEITNILGQTVRKFSPVDDAASEHSISWDGTDANGRPLASGLYFARLVTRSGSATTKIVLLR